MVVDITTGTDGKDKGKPETLMPPSVLKQRRAELTSTNGQDNQGDIPENYEYINLTNLPKFSELQKAVQQKLGNCSWFTKYGVDWLQLAFGFVLLGIGLELLRNNNFLSLVIGTLLLGIYHATASDKGGHLSTHGALCDSKAIKNFWTVFFIEFIGSYSSKMAAITHIKLHHPYTNVIGFGDSSSWKVPFLSRSLYLFVAPLFLPLITPFVATYQLLVEEKDVPQCIKFWCIMSAGILLHASLLVYISEFTWLSAILYLPVYRAVLSIPYIHVNIFQHIGLPMFSPEKRPVRIYQMSHGVLNLDRSILLNFAFGDSLIDCHIEHHLFPNFSDYMCRLVKPQVSAFLKAYGLPYKEAEYIERVQFFWHNYTELMVDAPPITHFIGIQ